MNLRPRQATAVRDGVAFLRGGKGKRLYAAPTGYGKSLIELAVQTEVPEAWIITPRIEIVRGMLEKRGHAPTTEAELRELAFSQQITTPMVLRNRLMAGTLAPPSALILDEAHHDLASTWQDILALCGYPVTVGYTATPYRGTPRGTTEFLTQWGQPTWITTFREASEDAFITMPCLRMLPLVDDDEVEISNGEFQQKAVTTATLSRLDELVDKIACHYDGKTWDRSTMFSVSSTEVARELVTRMNACGLFAVAVLQDTSYSDRETIFDGCVNRICALVQINVVSEGVDLPIRRLIDLAPTLSPVLWLQRFGRITRPHGVSEYVCTNRNLFRHAYTLDGMVQTADLVKAQAAFPPSAKTASLRVVGMEALGRLKPVLLPLATGLQATMYCMTAIEGNAVVEYCVIAHPGREDVFWAKRTSLRTTAERIYGKWEKSEPPLDLKGYASIQPKPITEKMGNWWKRAASRHGLDVNAEVDRKIFVALPVLSDTGSYIK